MSRASRQRQVLRVLGVDIDDEPNVSDEGEAGGPLPAYSFAAKVTGRLFDVTLQTIVCVMYLAIIVIVNTAVFYRYVLNSPIIWSDTVAIWTFIWMSMLAAGMAIPAAAHMRIDVVPNRFRSVRIRLAFKILTFVSFILTGVLLWRSGIQLMDVTGDRKGTAVDVPLRYAMMAIPAGAALFAVQGVRELVRSVRERHVLAEPEVVSVDGQVPL